MNRYESYKDSEVGWIGEIPSSWKVVNLNAICSQRSNKNKNLEEDNVLSLSYGRIKRRARNNEGLLPESFDGYNIIEEGDVVLRLTDLQNDMVSLRVGRATERGIITSAYTTLIPSVDSRYLFYQLASFDYWKGFYGLAGGVRQSLNYEGIKKLRFLLPSEKEQVAISDYLDEKTAEIDALIVDTEKSIELLEEYRKSVISEAVTKGLDPDVPMKDSGIGWIDDIPKHWKTTKLKYLISSIEAGKSVDASSYPSREGEPGVLTLSAVYKGEFNHSANKAVEDPAAARELRCPIKAGSLLVSRCNTSEWVGTAAIVDCGYDNLYLPDKIWQLILTGELLCRWVWYALQAQYAREYFAVNSVGASPTMQNISKQDLMNIPVPLPPVSEIRAIEERLDIVDEEAKMLREIHERLSDLLSELRQSCVSEVVTGKFKVPGVE